MNLQEDAKYFDEQRRAEIKSLIALCFQEIHCYTKDGQFCNRVVIMPEALKDVLEMLIGER